FHLRRTEAVGCVLAAADLAAERRAERGRAGRERRQIDRELAGVLADARLAIVRGDAERARGLGVARLSVGGAAFAMALALAVVEHGVGAADRARSPELLAGEDGRVQIELEVAAAGRRVDAAADAGAETVHDAGRDPARRERDRRAEEVAARAA